MTAYWCGKQNWQAETKYAFIKFIIIPLGKA